MPHFNYKNKNALDFTNFNQVHFRFSSQVWSVTHSVCDFYISHSIQTHFATNIKLPYIYLHYDSPWQLPQWESDFSECHSNRHISFQDKTTARIFQLKLYVLNSMQIFYFQCLLRLKIINLYRTANINIVSLFNSYLNINCHHISEHRVATQQQQQLQHCDGGGAAAISPHSATCDRNKKHYSNFSNNAYGNISLPCNKQNVLAKLPCRFKIYLSPQIGRCI